MDNIVIGIIGFVSGVSLVMVWNLVGKVSQLQRHVVLILQRLEIDPTKLPDVAALSERVKELARDPARKIEAIKVLRDETGAGLADAKDAVESYIRSLDR